MCDSIHFINMHVEIKVAQNFVLNFLYNKLPRRRVNLFGEELESALRDKFADHWYPDKPFKGSAFRCLKITDPADPVLNRAARESGNPVPDIVENLPTDLAIWIDPGEVSYRIGEKGSVKILYSESLDGSYLQNYALEDTNTPEAAAVAAATAAAMAAAASFQNNAVGRVGSGASSGSMVSQGGPAGGQNFLPLDNLNLSMGGLSLNSNQTSQISPSQQPQQQQQQPQQSPQQPQSQSGAKSPQQQLGFAPFHPRPHQPITYTAGTFAQTKFGSTKLKSNAKKTNRMSPTEFSNYIKQRAMQKQGSMQNNPVGAAVVSQQPANPVAPQASTSNGFINSSNASTQRTNSNRQLSTNGGFHSHHNSGNLNYGGGSGRIPPHQNSQDPYFYPLFPDRGSNQGGGQQQSNNVYYQQQQQFGGSSGSSSASSSSSLSSSSNPWSFGDADAELFLQDILTVGLQKSSAGNAAMSPSSKNLFNDYSSFNNDFGSIGSSSFGSNGSSSLGLSMLNNLGMGSAGGSGSSSTFNGASLFANAATGSSGTLDSEPGITAAGGLKANAGNNGVVVGQNGGGAGLLTSATTVVGNNSSANNASSATNNTTSSSASTAAEKYGQQQRVLVANWRHDGHQAWE